MWFNTAAQTQNEAAQEQIILNHFVNINQII